MNSGGSCDFSLELSLKPARVEDVSAEAASGPAADALSSAFAAVSLSTVGTPNYAGRPGLTSPGSPLFLQDQYSVSAHSATAQLPPTSEDRPILDGEIKLSNMLLGRTKFTFQRRVALLPLVAQSPQLSVSIHANMKLSFRICHAALPDGTMDRKEEESGINSTT
ncbi:hypothetical protein HK405_004730 [Cladochytrium tenue]|nr:hypothetical protein HK405_004730 [Cladochytrium tenue]